MSSAHTSIEEDPCNPNYEGKFTTGWHVGAIFIQILVSFLGTAIPLWTKKKGGKYTKLILSLGRNFGNGVILATAFCHMLIGATERFSSPCLPSFFQESYTAFAGVFCLLAILTVQLVQYLAVAYTHKAQTDNSLQVEEDEPLIQGEKRKRHNSPYRSVAEDHDEHTHSVLLSSGTDRKISTYMLELGIATHSVIIGITLGMCRDDEFTALCVALAFHQFFEGMALSSTVLSSGFRSLAQPIGVVIFYTLTTPLGVLIGILISSSHNPNSVTSLVTEGILDSFSAGILIYDGLVNMLNSNITHSASFHSLSVWARVGQFAALWLGASVMAFIGAWA